MPHTPPAYDDSHLPPLGEGTVKEIRDAAGIGKPDPRTQRKWSAMHARELRAIELTAAGATYAQIAEVLSITRTAARQLVDRALERRALEVHSRDTESARALMLDQLGTLYRRWFPLAVGNPAVGDPPQLGAAEFVLKVLDRVAKIQGLEAPVKIAGRVDVVLTPQDAEERLLAIVADLDHTHERANTMALEGTYREGHAA